MAQRAAGGHIVIYPIAVSLHALHCHSHFDRLQKFGASAPGCQMLDGNAAVRRRYLQTTCSSAQPQYSTSFPSWPSAVPTPFSIRIATMARV